MAREQITAPLSDTAQRAQRARDLRGKGSKRTPAEAAELLDVLVARIEDLEHRLDEFAAGR